MPLKRMLEEGRSFGPKAVALLLEAFDGIVPSLICGVRPSQGGERLVSGGGDFNADHSDTVFHWSRCRLAQDRVPHCFGRTRPRQQI